MLHWLPRVKWAPENYLGAEELRELLRVTWAPENYLGAEELHELLRVTWAPESYMGSRKLHVGSGEFVGRPERFAHIAHFW